MSPPYIVKSDCSFSKKAFIIRCDRQAETIAMHIPANSIISDIVKINGELILYVYKIILAMKKYTVSVSDRIITIFKCLAFSFENELSFPMFVATIQPIIRTKKQGIELIKIIISHIL